MWRDEIPQVVDDVLPHQEALPSPAIGCEVEGPPRLVRLKGGLTLLSLISLVRVRLSHCPHLFVLTTTRRRRRA